jgi:cullin 3
MLHTTLKIYPSIGHHLSQYLDSLLTRGQKSPPGQVSQAVADVISLFRYLQNRDVFEDCYRGHLAVRLLSEQSLDADLERGVLAQLKAECGHQFTSRMEGMFKDMASSKTLMDLFTSSPHCDKNIKFSATILTTGFWPVPPTSLCTLPAEAAAVLAKFETFYKQAHSGRRLALQPHLGGAELRVRFNSAQKILCVSTFQMIILLLFNNTDSLTFQQVQTDFMIDS